MIRTKIVATMGPATADPASLRRLLESGVDVARLNFSHGSLADHTSALSRVRHAAAAAGRTVAILGDLCGPKIRLGTMADERGGGVPVVTGQLVRLAYPALATPGHTGPDGIILASASHAELLTDTSVGDPILVEDGLLKFVCSAKTKGYLELRCLSGGILKNRKGINLPSTRLSVPSITEEDWAAADWAIDNGLDYLALSFVRRAEDLLSLRRHIESRGASLHLIAKIEQAEALDQIESILDACDGMMIARGDLGVEMDVARVPIIQKDLIRKCQLAGKPVIVATQMLQSMIESPTPTRAEVSDVANAIFDGTDAVMLSGETSVGAYAVETVQLMAHVADVTEAYIRTQPLIPLQPAALRKLQTPQVSLAAARGVWQIAADLTPPAKAVVVWSQTGTTARVFSKMRFAAPVVALSADEGVLRRMALHYGVVPVRTSRPKDTAGLLADVSRLLQERQLAAPGDRVIIVAGTTMGTPGTLDGILIHTL